MSKMYYFSNKFSKIAKRPFTFKIDDLNIWPNCGFSSWWQNQTL